MPRPATPLEVHVQIGQQTAGAGKVKCCPAEIGQSQKRLSVTEGKDLCEDKLFLGSWNAYLWACSFEDVDARILEH